MAADPREAKPQGIKAQLDGGDPGYGFWPLITDYEAPYHAQSLTTQDVAAWRPPMRSGEFGSIVRRDLTLARIQDIVRNDPHAGSALDKLCDHIVGAGLRFSSNPDGEALGVKDRKVIRALGKNLELEWRAFSEDPRRFADVQRRLSVNGLFRLLMRTWLTYGEACYALMLNAEPGAKYRTSILTIDPDRICNPYGERDTLTRRMGVEMTPLGRPLGYHVSNAHLGDYWAPAEQMSWTFVPRQTDYGRPIFVHGFEPARDGDGRGISPLISVIARMRMVSKFADNELAAATINSLFAATIESDLPTQDIAERLSPSTAIRESFGGQAAFAGQMEFFEKYPARLSSGARIPVLPPGAELKMNHAPRQTTSIPAFETAFLQSISSRLGLAYEQLKGDWSRTNYSSARAALNEVWRSIGRMSRAFTEQIVDPTLLAWADEAFASGLIKVPAGAPDFWDAPGAYLGGRWLGPPRGWIDPVKEQEASVLRMESMTSTLRDECAEQGKDYEDVLDQIAQEEEDLKERKLTRLSLVAAVQSMKGPKPDSQEAQGPAGPADDKGGRLA